jgi:hypothetical protein
MKNKTYEQVLRDCNNAIGTDWHENSRPAIAGWYECKSNGCEETILLVAAQRTWWWQHEEGQMVSLPNGKISKWRGPARHIKNYNPLFCGPHPETIYGEVS